MFATGAVQTTSSMQGIPDLPSITAPENVMIMIVGILSALANAVLVYIIFKNPLKCFRTRMSYLMVSLGIADMLTGINALLYGILIPSQKYPLGLLYCFWITVLCSVLTIATMSIERWSAILYPFKSGLIFTKQVTIYTCIGIWLFSIIGGFSIYFADLAVMFSLCTLIEVILVFIAMLYIAIFHSFKQTLRRRTSTVKEISRTSGVGSSEVGPYRIPPKVNTETQLLAVVLILVVILTVTFIPYNLAIQISFGYRLFLNQRFDSVDLFARYFFPFKLSNFLLNPFVYGWRLPRYRKSFELVLCLWRRKKRVSVGPSIPATINQGYECGVDTEN